MRSRSGVTVVEPVADVEVNPPGLMPMLVAPLVFQVSELLPPVLMLVGFAVNEVIVGFAFTAVTVTVAVLVTEPCTVGRCERIGRGRAGRDCG